jgi:VCBS repeat-containing protein
MPQIYHLGKIIGDANPGHEILNSSGTAMTQRNKLQINNATITDDPTNDKTIVTPSGGGGGGGSTIKVTTTETTLRNKTITLTGSTTLTATFDSNGVATFTGVTMTGTLTLYTSDGTSSATKAISVPYFGNYEETISFFICTLSISTTSTELYSQTITVTKSGSTVGTTAFSAQGAATFRVHETGTYTLTCTYQGEPYQESITIVSGDDGTTKSVTINMNDVYDVTVTLYSAANDLVTWVDDRGAMVAMTAGLNDAGGLDPGVAQNVRIVKSVAPGDPAPSITFNSSVADNPNDLSARFTKTITLDKNMREMYIMPTGHVLYWYGWHLPYTARAIKGSSSPSVWPGVAPTVTENTNYIIQEQSTGGNCGRVDWGDAIDLSAYTTAKALGYCVTNPSSDTNYSTYGASPTNTTGYTPTFYKYFSTTRSLVTQNVSATSTNYLFTYTDRSSTATRVLYLYAFWLE